MNMLASTHIKRRLRIFHIFCFQDDYDAKHYRAFYFFRVKIAHLTDLQMKTVKTHRFFFFSSILQFCLVRN